MVFVGTGSTPFRVNSPFAHDRCYDCGSSQRNQRYTEGPFINDTAAAAETYPMEKANRCPAVASSNPDVNGKSTERE